MNAGATGLPPRARRTGAAVTSVVVLVMVMAGAGLGTDRAHAAGKVTIAVTGLTPTTATATTPPTQGTSLQVAGSIANDGTRRLRDVTVRLHLSTTRVNSRSELSAVLAGDVTSQDEGQVLTETRIGRLGPGRSAPFALSAALGAAEDPTTPAEFGVYVLGVEVVGHRPGQPGGARRQALVRIPFPRVPGDPGLQPTGFGWLWPVVGAPVRLADGSFANDSLAGQLAPGGRLARLLEAGTRLQAGSAVTWAVDPELVESVADMSDGYQVTTPEGDLVDGGGTALATRWLDGLRTATSGADVLVLPYGDPDLSALVHGRQGGDLERAARLGNQVVHKVLPAVTTLDGFTWPPAGFADRRTLTALSRAGASTVVLDARALPTAFDLSYTPSGRARLGPGTGGLAALLADSRLTDLLAAAGPDPEAAVPAAQRVLAETAMITSELPATGPDRAIVLAPPRRWAPSQAFLDALVGTFPQAPWATPIGLRELAARAPAEVDHDRLRYPDDQRQARLPDPYLNGIGGLHASMANFAAILTDRSEILPGLQRSVLRLESSWWRGRENRVNRLAIERTYLSEQRQRVRVQPGNFTFGSRTGNIPLTLVNELPQEVVVLLALTPQSPRLRLRGVGPQHIGPHQKVQVEVPATAIAGGTVNVEASLHTTSGAPYGQPVQLRVTVTQLGTLALVITVVAGTVLFVAAGFRLVRRIRAAGRRPEVPPERAPAPEDVSV